MNMEKCSFAFHDLCVKLLVFQVIVGKGLQQDRGLTQRYILILIIN